MLLEYWELGRSELNTPGDMGGEKNDRDAGDPHRCLRVNNKLYAENTQTSTTNMLVIFTTL